MSLTYLKNPIDNTALNMPFDLHTLQWAKQNRWQENTEPIRLCYFVVVWIRKGVGTFQIDMNQHEIKDNTIYCISPGQIHHLAVDENADGCVIYFTSEFLCLTEENYELLFNSGLFNTFTQCPVIPVSDEISTDLADLCAKMITELDNLYLLKSALLRSYLKIFLIYLTRQFEHADKTTHDIGNLKLVARFFSLLEKDYASQKQVAYYAAELGVTANYLNEMIKKSSGVSASANIRQRIILEAKRNLINMGYSMKEIAYNLGFDDVAHFSKYFKNATGANFTEYKKELASSLK
jgi:AraC family transcriptional activator of pobA